MADDENEGLEPIETGPASADLGWEDVDEGLVGIPIESVQRGAEEDDGERR